MVSVNLTREQIEDLLYWAYCEVKDPMDLVAKSYELVGLVNARDEVIEPKPGRYEGMLEKLSEFESRIFINPTTWKYIRLDPLLPVGQFYIGCEPFGDPDPDKLEKARRDFYPTWLRGAKDGP